jgi:hypothetical protein
LKLTDKVFKFAVSGLQADELRKHLLVGEKLSEFVDNEREKNDTFRFLLNWVQRQMCECEDSSKYDK